MKRLTGRAPDGTAYLYNMGGTNAALDRLAAYEDTGLEPEELEYIARAKRGERMVTEEELKQAGVSQAEIDRLFEIAVAESEGRLLVLPCKVGDTLYEPTNRGTISTYLVRGIRSEPFGSIWVEWDILDGFVYRSISGVNADEIGKTVFLTSEEAEKTLEVEQ